MRRTIKPIPLTLCLAAALSAGGTSFAQSYPTKPVRVIVPSGAGGSVDTLGRSDRLWAGTTDQRI